MKVVNSLGHLMPEETLRELGVLSLQKTQRSDRYLYIT